MKIERSDVGVTMWCVENFFNERCCCEDGLQVRGCSINKLSKRMYEMTVHKYLQFKIDLKNKLVVSKAAPRSLVISAARSPPPANS